ncbi:MAG: hypothetical protein HN849_24460 [Victivallales bacterium]|nr:hypothetical protein [Victivallales bacterium]
MRLVVFTTFLLALVAGSASSAESGLDGDLRADSLAFYVVHTGGPLQVSLVFSRPAAEPRNASRIRLPYTAFWQCFGADERPLTRGLERFASAETLSQEVAVINLPNAAAGVYQVRCAQTGTTTRLVTNGARFGVLACRARQSGIREGWLCVPAGVDALSFKTYAATVQAYDEQGRLLGDSKKRKALPVTAGQLVRLAIKYQWENGAFGVLGVPGILCPDAETARAIGGSVETSADGRRFAHKFQVRMWDWMRARLPADFAIAPADLQPLAKQWLADPRNAGLLGITGPFNFIPRILGEQDLDPESPGYGLGTSTSWLGPAYVIDKPFNPYRRQPAIVNRLVLQEFAQYLKMAENGTFNGNDWDHYAGGDGLGFRKRAFQFGYVAPHVDRQLRDLWFEGAEKVMDCMGLRRVSCENQTSHWLLDHWLLAEGSGETVYRDLAHWFAQALASPEWNLFMATGYQQERYGPDATYQGLAAAQQAIYYRYSGDKTVRDGLRRVYDLFNHTVAPEPDGAMRGASNFSHRTTGSWVKKQYSAGVQLMAAELPEAGVWYPNYDLGEERTKDLEHIQRYLTETWNEEWYERNRRWYTSYAYHPWLAFFHKYVFPMAEIKKSPWPAQSAKPFFKNRNNEFVFAKRAGYYAAMYTGRTSQNWVRPSIKPQPVAKGWEQQEGVWVPTTGNAKKTAWTPTQGLSLVWFPGYGNWLLGKNWNVYTIQGTRADLAGGKVAWPDYYTCKTSVNEKDGRVQQDLQLFDHDVSVRREIEFAEEAIRLRVTLSTEAGFAPKRLVEQFPFLDKTGLTVCCRVDKAWQDTGAVGDRVKEVSAVQVRNAEGVGVELAFPRPVTISFGPPTRLHGQTMRLLEVDFGGPLRKDDSRQLDCRIAPLAAQSQ